MANIMNIKALIFGFNLVFSLSLYAQNTGPNFVYSDLENFWIAYDSIQSVSDTTLQKKYFEQLYLDKASPGLESIIELRRYSTQEYLTAINSYPDFWQSIRTNTNRIEEFLPEIRSDLKKLKSFYPQLTESTIYFTIGAFRTNGTIDGNRILIGCELSLGDSSTIIREFPSWRQAFYQNYKPLDNLALLITHEYIHTQQKTHPSADLLSICIYEGVAEFISCIATGKPSNTPAIEFGKNNTEKVVDKFIEDMFLEAYIYNWLWGENRNELKVRDLGYYIGYEICERYYEKSSNKEQALIDLINLDFNNTSEVEQIANASGLFPKKISRLLKKHEKSRPKVKSISPFKNKSDETNFGTIELTIKFSRPMNQDLYSFDFGPLGALAAPKIEHSTKKWSEDGKRLSFEVTVEPIKKYQLVLGAGFMSEDKKPLKPYLLEFTTKAEYEVE